MNRAFRGFSFQFRKLPNRFIEIVFDDHQVQSALLSHLPPLTKKRIESSRSQLRRSIDGAISGRLGTRSGWFVGYTEVTPLQWACEAPPMLPNVKQCQAETVATGQISLHRVVVTSDNYI